MKRRIIGFLEICDEIPDKAKYLFSKSEKIITEEEPLRALGEELSDETVQKTKEICLHYYEVDTEDFEDLVKDGFFKQTKSERYMKGIQKYKIPSL